MKKINDVSKKSKKAVSGQPKDDIIIRPTVSEAKMTSAVITFGRMNPPTVGHLHLVEKILKVARDIGGTPLVYLSHTQDAKKNPLSYDEKLRLAQAAFGKRLVVRSEARNIIDILKELQSRFNSVTVVVGSDRVPEFERILKTYNNKEFKFKTVSVVSAGTRDPDAEDVTGMSASKMRKLAAENKLTQFKQGLPPQLHSMADMIMSMVRTGMKMGPIKEQVIKMDEQNQETEALDEVLSLQQRRRKAMVARRHKGKLKIARARAQRRMAASSTLKKRAGRAAVRLIKRRVAGMRGTKYSQLSPAEKAMIDKKVAMRKGIIKRLAQRLMPRVRRSELQRYKRYRTRKESINQSFEAMLTEQNIAVNINSVNEMAMIVDKFLQTIERNNNITEKAYSNLVLKSHSTGIDLSELINVYNQGFITPKEGHTPEQAGFLAVNHFVNEGKKKGLWDNIHAKRARIKAGSGERMRKPGSEGAPTSADFKRAAENVDLKAHAESKRQQDKEYVKQQRNKINEEFESLVYSDSIHELFFKVQIENLPAMYINSNSAGAIKMGLRKLLKRPEEQIVDIQRVTQNDVRTAFKEKLKGKLADEVDNEGMEEQLQKFIDEAALAGTDKLVNLYKQGTPGQSKGVKGTNQHKLKVRPAVDGMPNESGMLRKPTY